MKPEAVVRYSFVRRSSVLVLAVLTAAVLNFVGALPARAAGGTPHLCEAYGSYCLAVGDLTDNAWVTAGNPGRYLQRISLGGRFDGHPTYLLQFTAKPKLCVGTDGFASVEVKHCNGGIGIVWAQWETNTDNSHPVYKYINRHASQYYEDTEYLSNTNRAGARFYTRPAGKTGIYYKFEWK